MSKNYEKVLLASRTETATGQGPDFEITGGRSAIILLNVSAHAGTLPTLDVDVMAKDPISGLYLLVKSFVQVTTTDSLTGIIIGAGDAADLLPRKGRVEWAITGSAGQSYTFSVGATINS